MVAIAKRERCRPRNKMINLAIQGVKMNKGYKDINAAQPAGTQELSNRRPPTSADVGKLAGVSRSTVSLVLNQVPDSRITNETRERVLAAANELGYIPHAAASALR